MRFVTSVTRLMALTGLLCGISAQAALPRASAVPGGVAIVDLGAAVDPEPRVEWDGKRVLTVIDGTRRKAVVGIALAMEP